MKKLIYTAEALTLLGKPIEGIHYELAVSRVRNILQSAKDFKYDYTGSLQQNISRFYTERGFDLKNVASQVGSLFARTNKHGILEEPRFKTLLRKNKFPPIIDIDVCINSTPDESVNPVIWREKNGHLRPFCNKCGKELYGGEIGWTGSVRGYDPCPKCNP